MTTPTKKTTIVADGLARLISSAQTPRIRGLVKPWLEQWQNIENAAWEVTTLRYLDDAEGVQLDVLGVILGRARGNLGDDDYKIALRAEILVNRAEGVPPQIEQLLALCCPVPYELREMAVATLEIELLDAVLFNVPTLWSILMRAKAAGVRLELTYSPEDPDTLFRFADYDPDDPTYATPVYDTAHGLGDAAETMGGLLIHTQASA
jgi:hypothetical protein